MEDNKDLIKRVLFCQKDFHRESGTGSSSVSIPQKRAPETLDTT